MAGTANSGGRNKLSQADHELAGTARADRQGSKGLAPDPPKGRPDTPLALTGHARSEWTRMVDRLEASHTLSLVDDAALYQYCCLFGETEDVQDARQATAAIIRGLPDQINAAAPALAADLLDQLVKLRLLDAKYTTQLRQGHMAIRAYLVEFGMTPSARTRVSQGRREGDGARPASPLERFTQPKARA